MTEFQKFLLVAGCGLAFMLWLFWRTPARQQPRDLWKWVWGEPDDQDPADTPPKA
jgi:hypothetical protein